MTQNSPQEQNLMPMLIALIALIIVTLTTAIIFLKKDDIENDLTNRTNSKLQELGLDVLSVEFSGRDGSVSISEATRATADEILKQVEETVAGVRSLTLHEKPTTTSQATSSTSETQTIEVTKEPVIDAAISSNLSLGSFSLKKENGQWSLTGTVHSQNTKDSLIEKISAKLDVIDNIVVEEKDTTLEWPVFLPLILSKLDKLQNDAEIRLDENLMVVQGTTQTQVDKQSILLTVRESFGNKISVQSMLDTLEPTEKEKQ